MCALHKFHKKLTTVMKQKTQFILILSIHVLDYEILAQVIQNQQNKISVYKVEPPEEQNGIILLSPDLSSNADRC